MTDGGTGSTGTPDPGAEAEARAGPLGRMAAMLAAISVRRPGLTLVFSAVLGLASCWVLVTRFALDTDALRMFPEDLPWRQAEQAIDAAFPQRDNVIAVVMDGVTPDAAERAAATLAAWHCSVVRSPERVARPDAEAFFRRSALLFADEAVVRAATERIISAQPMIGTLAADPSLRGVAQTLKLVAEGVERGTPGADLAQLAVALTALGDAAEAATPGRIAPLDWSRLFTGRAPEALALRRFVLVRPALDYSRPRPGERRHRHDPGCRGAARPRG